MMVRWDQTLHRQSAERPRAFQDVEQGSPHRLPESLFPLVRRLCAFGFPQKSCESIPYPASLVLACQIKRDNKTILPNGEIFRVCFVCATCAQSKRNCVPGPERTLRS